MREFHGRPVVPRSIGALVPGWTGEFDAELSPSLVHSPCLTLSLSFSTDTPHSVSALLVRLQTTCYTRYHSMWPCGSLVVAARRHGNCLRGIKKACCVGICPGDRTRLRDDRVYLNTAAESI